MIKTLSKFFLILFLLLFLTSCIFTRPARPKVVSAANTDSEVLEEGAEISLSQDQGLVSDPFYSDFPDIKIPFDMNIVYNNSFLFRTKGIVLGLLSLRGRLEPEVTSAFFEQNMVKDGWKIMSSFKAKKSILFFGKVDKWCIITIDTQSRDTTVEIWVSPVSQK